MKQLQNFINSGVNPNTPPDIAQKITLSNIFVMLLILVAGIPFTIISVLNSPPLTINPAGASVVALLTPLLNKAGHHKLARSLFCWNIAFSVGLYHPLLLSEGAPPLLSFYVLQLSFALIPFLLFTTREWQLLVLNVLPAAIFLIFFSPINSLLELSPSLDDAFLREEGLYYYLTLYMGIIVCCSCVLGLAFMHNSAEKQNKKLIINLKDQQEELKSREKEMLQNLNALQLARKNEESRKHFAEGLAHFNNILRQQTDIQDLGDSLVREICKFLNANQAGFFIVDPEAKQLQLVSSYAYSRKKYYKKDISFGEGLLGQTYLEKEYVYLTEVPENYINITSGLGDAPPRSILIVPFIFNEEVKAMLEIASFKEFNEHEIEFVHKVGEGVAATIHNLQTSKKTMQLLESMQANAEIVKQQEEEMRQNMEELAATQEEMQRKEKEYLKRIQEYEQANKA